jgi:hypothetical protein
LTNAHSDSRFTIDRACKYCNAKMMRAARYCPSCHVAVDDSGRKMPRGAGVVPILIGAVTVLGLVGAATLHFVADGPVQRDHDRPVQRPIEPTAAEIEDAGAYADVLCWQKFLEETGGLVPDAVHGAYSVG